jgi:3-deoxy-manno-octulosonate cytidylyltransferase (CMP-KDO synthetase)
VRRVLGVIPARMDSARFPGKPLALIHGRTMIEHVYRGASASRSVDEVVIATCDDEIAVAARSFGARVVMTSRRHECATDRVAEAIAGDSADVVAMVQGDEPLVRPEMIDAAVAAIVDDADAACVNLAAPIKTAKELHDPNTIKVVCDRAGNALYFSRQPIPHIARRDEAPRHMKQVCVMAFRRAALERFAQLPRGPLEIAESVDMLRFLENGVPVRMSLTGVDTHAVDCPADLARVSSLFDILTAATKS